MTNTPNDELIIVALGASAGGLEPLQTFFDAMPAGHNLAFVVIQHLSPDFKSLMQELLTRHTKMTVVRAENDMPVRPGSIFLIPPGKNLTIENGALKLFDQVTKDRLPNFAIDMFFESLATDRGRRSIAVVLAGTGSDGSRGIRAINEAGGLVMAQDPSTAQFDGMPRSAIATGCVQSILPPSELARSIYQYAAQFDNSADVGRSPVAREVLSEIVSLLKQDNGVDFSHYRPATIVRRMNRRISLGAYGEVEDYLDVLRSNADERTALRNDLLIGVTSFFRDAPAWQFLDESVLAKLIEERTAGDPLRIWVTACSTGEEVYTMAILVQEAMRRAGKLLEVKIFATDIDTRALEVAALGIYSANMVEAVDADLLHRYFSIEGSSYRVARQLRETVIFAEHNLTRDAAFTSMDIVTCRNALIYMEPTLQQRVLAALHFSLRVGGTLFLGAAESLGSLDPEFRTLDPKWKLYSKRRDVKLNFGGALGGMRLVRPVVARTKNPTSPGRSDASFVALETSFRGLLHNRSAAAFVVGDQLTLLHAFGKVQQFLQVPEGQGTQTLTDMVPEHLRAPLGAALHQVKNSMEFVTYTGLQSASDPERSMELTVGRIADENAYVILMEDGATQLQRPETPFTIDEHVSARVRDLEHELRQSRESLQATIEELEATNEEHQATNEELLASNEQLQSTNEELQSVNEELYTVNAEHQSKIKELTDLNNDMNNLLRSSQLGTLFLDSALRVRKFTPATTAIVALTDQDIGREIETFSHSTNLADLWAVLRLVVENGKPQERSLATKSGQSFYMRAEPYIIDENQTSGVVANFFEMELLRRGIESEQLQLRTTGTDRGAHSRSSEAPPPR